MGKEHITKIRADRTKEVMECTHCGRKNLVLNLDGKPALDQKCTNCWKHFG